MGAKTPFSVLYISVICAQPLRMGYVCLMMIFYNFIYVQVHFSNVKYDSASYVSK